MEIPFIDNAQFPPVSRLSIVLFDGLVLPTGELFFHVGSSAASSPPVPVLLRDLGSEFFFPPRRIVPQFVLSLGIIVVSIVVVSGPTVISR